MDMPSAEQSDRYLQARLSRAHLRQRLGIEAEREDWVFGQGRNFFHIENWYSIHAVIRGLLRLAMLHARGRRNALDIRLQEHAFAFPLLPAAFEGFRLLQLSDLHLDMNDGITNAVIAKVQGLDYEACVLTGDYRAQTHGDWQPAIRQLGRLREHLHGDVYAVLGNHDSIRMVPVLESLGIRVLLNESIRIEQGGDSIHIAGVDDPHYYRADNLEKAADGIPNEEVAILLCHSPELYRHAAHAGFDAMLSGHTHGGQICLPGGVPLMCNANCPRAFCVGPWRHGGMLGYTSRGTGVSVVDVRLNCPAEVTLHTLHRA